MASLSISAPLQESPQQAPQTLKVLKFKRLMLRMVRNMLRMLRIAHRKRHTKNQTGSMACRMLRVLRIFKEADGQSLASVLNAMHPTTVNCRTSMARCS